MISLIKEIDRAWAIKERLCGVYPDRELGYFSFRNNVILKYNRRKELYNNERKVNTNNSEMQF